MRGKCPRSRGGRWTPGRSYATCHEAPAADKWRVGGKSAPRPLREMFRADINDDGITELSVYCTGDWDSLRRAEHAAAVTLIRP